ncbi:hypothetical protein GGR22_000039 [Flavobacterium gossypii]|uniref:Lipocalin-like protein n=2 Tax=Flavobacterium TaxID=237 RepID=A0A495LXC7_9FLAO|nr:MULTISPECIES: hypothetical protein [Flavobacterium]MBA9071913.1 hypothetical protein [Flavobacterium gossypii]RKS17882.1 hypothetical protein CLV94_3324 [Flavobacterium endophyticum]
MKKSILKTVGIVVFAVVSMVSCSSDDSDGGNGGGSIDAAVGTFKGTFEVLDGPNAGQDYFDATLIITKVSNTELRMTPKSGEAYSNLTPKTIKVYNLGGDILVDGDAPAGTFAYRASSKALLALTKQQAATDITFTFSGTKQ